MNNTTTALFMRVLRKRIVDARINIANEAAMQISLESILGKIGHTEREFRFSARDRVDFFVHDPFGIAIELKLARSGGGIASVLRQLERYAEHGVVNALLLITSSYELESSMPGEIAGKPLHVINVGGAF
jgi:DNA-binding sugar fermentation-stimulating protein